MMREEDGVVTHYPGRHYEATLGSGFTKYFYADGQLISFERSPEYGDAYGRRYVFRDHLGSTSIIANGSGVRIWEDRYLPYGDIRYHSDTVTNTVQTRYRFTGQWLEDGLAASPENGLDRGLYLYEARWYDASLGRFIQPDTIVPEPGNPQALNRYSYTLNNPVKFTDPSGHCIVQYSGDVRMNEGPYGTSGLCPYTETPLVEGQHAIEQYHELLAAQEPWSSTFERPIPEIIAGALVPEEGTKSAGGCGSLGAIVYGQLCAGTTIDNQGDFFFFISPEGGAMLLGSASGTVFYATSNASNGELLLSPYADIGASGGLGLVAGYEYSTSDSNGLITHGGKIDQDKYSVGFGFDIGVGPVEGHYGGGTAIPVGRTYNIYDAFNIQPASSSLHR